jgi:transaldolase
LGFVTKPATNHVSAKPQAAAGQKRKLRIAVYADSANLNDMLDAYHAGTVQGFTTNPTLMAKAGVKDYESFAHDALAAIPDLPISFEVFADHTPDMGRQARKIASWGQNIFVKVPVMTTTRVATLPLVRELTGEGIQLNVTALMTAEQVAAVRDAVEPGVRTIISLFAGRVADTGRDPVPIMRTAVESCRDRPELMVLWASPREVLNVYQAEACGCHVITATPDLLAKLSLNGKDLDDYSRETVQMFYDDARRAGYVL